MKSMKTLSLKTLSLLVFTLLMSFGIVSQSLAASTTVYVIAGKVVVKIPGVGNTDYSLLGMGEFGAQKDCEKARLKAVSGYDKEHEVDPTKPDYTATAMSSSSQADGTWYELTEAGNNWTKLNSVTKIDLTFCAPKIKNTLCSQ